MVTIGKGSGEVAKGTGSQIHHRRFDFGWWANNAIER